MTRPERIREWVAREFARQHVETVTRDLIDVATGNRDGNRFERSALDKIFPEDTGELHLPSVRESSDRGGRLTPECGQREVSLWARKGTCRAGLRHSPWPGQQSKTQTTTKGAP